MSKMQARIGGKLNLLVGISNPKGEESAQKMHTYSGLFVEDEDAMALDPKSKV